MKLPQLAAVCLVTLLAACAQAPVQTTPFKVKLIAFNDFHANLQSPGSFGENASVPVAQRPAVGRAQD